MTNLPTGSIVALITPFHEDGSINFEKIDELVNWHIEQGTDAILVLGTTGESSTMSHEEDDAVLAAALKAADGRIPVIAGAGSNNTQTQLEKSKKYDAMGAAAVLLITPYYNKANAEGLARHFETVADQISIPVILYNVPGRTGVNLPVSVVKRLAKHPNIQAIKEASGNISYAADLAKILNEDFIMYSGNDDMIVPMLSLGASGVISVLANVVPDKTHELCQAWFEGDVNRAKDLQLDYLDVVRGLFIEVNPIPVKEALNIMGKEVGGYRLPLCEMAPENQQVLAKSMKEAGIV